MKHKTITSKNISFCASIDKHALPHYVKHWTGYLPVPTMQQATDYALKLMDIDRKVASCEGIKLEFFCEAYGQKLGTYYFESGEFYPSEWFDEHPEAWNFYGEN